VEDAVILTRMGPGLWRNGWRSKNLYAYMLLTLREGNGWSQEEHNRFFWEDENARYLIGDNEEGATDTLPEDASMRDWFKIASQDVPNGEPLFKNARENRQVARCSLPSESGAGSGL
jgi:hypothetical protein